MAVTMLRRTVILCLGVLVLLVGTSGGVWAITWMEEGFDSADAQGSLYWTEISGDWWGVTSGSEHFFRSDASKNNRAIFWGAIVPWQTVQIPPTEPEWATIVTRLRVAETNPDTVPTVGVIFNRKDARHYNMVVLKQVNPFTLQIILKQVGNFEGRAAGTLGQSTVPGDLSAWTTLQVSVQTGFAAPLSFDGTATVRVGVDANPYRNFILQNTSFGNGWAGLSAFKTGVLVDYFNVVGAI